MRGSRPLSQRPFWLKKSVIKGPLPLRPRVSDEGTRQRDGDAVRDKDCDVDDDRSRNTKREPS